MLNIFIDQDTALFYAVRTAKIQFIQPPASSVLLLSAT